MPKIKKQLIVLIFLLFAACSGQPRFEINEVAKDSFRNLPGTIGVRFYAKEVWSFVIKNGDLFPYAKFPEAPKEAASCTVSFGGPGIFPEGKDFDFGGVCPYLISPDKSRIVMAIIYKNIQIPIATDFILATLDDRKIVFKRGYEGLRSISGIAWSPDSQFFVILECTSKRSYLNILHLLSYMASHPVDKESYSIKVYDREGRFIVKTKIASGFIGSCGEIVWLSGK